MITTELVIVGGGPAGLCAAYEAAKVGTNVILFERDPFIGGQLVKQTHMFFGSKKQFASTRGIDIAEILSKRLESFDNVSIKTNSTVLGLYEDGVITVEENGKYYKVHPERILVATGAFEKVLAFPNNDLPGIYGAGAVQTLMNVHGVRPGQKVLMVGAGNIGLIVSYQLMQAGVEVVAILDAAPNIGGYLVHASKVRRMGVPILVKHTVKEALGDGQLEKAIVWKVDDSYNGITGTEVEYDVDVMCVSVGLTPLTELLTQANVDMLYVPELSGYVPRRDEYLATSNKSVYVAGDISGVEEASSAMVEGSLAGICIAKSLNKKVEDFEEQRKDFLFQLDSLRHGEMGNRIRQGIQKILIK